MAMDSRYRPLKPERTCQHLGVGSTGIAGRYYGRCQIGTAEDRQRWAGPERERQLAVAEALSAAMEERLGTLTEELWAAKARQLQYFEQPGQSVGADQATADLEELARRYMTEVEQLFVDRRELLDALNLPVDTLMDLFTEIFGRWIPQRSAATPAIPDEIVERFPEQAWWLLRPRAGAR
jgi:hypothetical protein